jgi:hypothetical protein
MHLTAPSRRSRSIGTGGRDPSEQVVTIVGMRMPANSTAENVFISGNFMGFASELFFESVRTSSAAPASVKRQLSSRLQPRWAKLRNTTVASAFFLTASAFLVYFTLFGLRHPTCVAA